MDDFKSGNLRICPLLLELLGPRDKAQLQRREEEHTLLIRMLFNSTERLFLYLPALIRLGKL